MLIPGSGHLAPLFGQDAHTMGILLMVWQ